MRYRYATDLERIVAVQNAESPSRFFLGGLPNALADVGQPGLRVGSPPGFPSGGGGGGTLDADLTVDRPHPAHAQGSARGGLLELGQGQHQRGRHTSGNTADSQERPTPATTESLMDAHSTPSRWA